MKKMLSPLIVLVSLLTSSMMMAQTASSDSGSDSSPVILPNQYITTIYNTCPEVTVTWSASLVNDQGAHQYEAIVVIQNNTEQILSDWCFAVWYYDTLVNHSSVLGAITSQPPHDAFPGWFALVCINTSHNYINSIPPHEIISFYYTAKLAEGQNTIVPPIKIFLNDNPHNKFNFVMTPAVTQVVMTPTAAP